MGATLPVISRWVKTSPEGISWLGFFYGGNIGGAVIGSLLAGFYLMRVYDVSKTTYVAVLLNFAVRYIWPSLSRSGHRSQMNRLPVRSPSFLPHLERVLFM
jgi:spermidine synthase